MARVVAKVLGKLCKREHRAPENPERSWRYVDRNTGWPDDCCACANERSARPASRERTKSWRKTPKAREVKRALDRRADQRARKNAARRTLNGRAKKAAYMRTPKMRARSNEYQRSEKYKATVKAWRDRRLRTDPAYKIMVKLRDRLSKALKAYTLRGKVRTLNGYGVDVVAIIEHLGPCPGLHALTGPDAYHIDHIRPLCSFDLTDAEQVRLAFAPENHRWLSAVEHRRKSALERRRHA